MTSNDLNRQNDDSKNSVTFKLSKSKEEKSNDSSTMPVFLFDNDKSDQNVNDDSSNEPENVPAFEIEQKEKVSQSDVTATQNVEQPKEVNNQQEASEFTFSNKSQPIHPQSADSLKITNVDSEESDLVERSHTTSTKRNYRNSKKNKSSYYTRALLSMFGFNIRN